MEELLQPLTVLVTATVYIPAFDTVIGFPISVEDDGVVHVYTELGSALLVPDKLTLGTAQVAVTDGAVPNTNVGEVLFAITVNEFAELVLVETQPVNVLVIAKVYTPAAVNVALD